MVGQARSLDRGGVFVVTRMPGQTIQKNVEMHGKKQIERKHSETRNLSDPSARLDETPPLSLVQKSSSCQI